MTRVLVAGVGNVLRRDDGFGAAVVAARIARAAAGAA
jgi:Ni,Fe-hydrogenase maturation factor